MVKRRRRTAPGGASAPLYTHTIPGRAALIERLEGATGPLGFEALCEALGVLEPEACEGLERRLAAMQRDGQIVRNRRGDFGVAEKMDLVRGRVAAHRNGYGFLIVDEASAGPREDLFLSPREMRAVMHGDRVLARVGPVDYRGRREAGVVDVLERGTQEVVGHYLEESGISFVSSSHRRVHQDVLIPPDGTLDARHGQLVVAELTRQPSKRNQPLGRVIEVLGEDMAPGMEIDVAIRAHDLPTAWPEAVETQIAGLSPDLGANAIAGRTDLRALPFVTIDGADARDFDDAVYCEPRARGFKLYVAIADVSSYVAPGTALDRHARARGTSVYFPGRVIPMLPEVLSNGLCSLNPDEDRLCLVCEMSVGTTGRVGSVRFREAVMRSHARLTYDEVARVVVERAAAARKRRRALLAHLDALYAVYKALLGARRRRGAIDLDTMEPRIVLGRDRKVAHIEPLRRNDAHRLIEECMIAANVAAARFLERHEQGLLYRVHDRPQADKLDNLNAYLKLLGLRLGRTRTPKPGDYASLVDQIADRPHAQIIQMMVLRSLSQAAYSPVNIGHFGLALEHYAHFTSPIRRYPDLLVHRAIRRVLGGGDGATGEEVGDDLVALGEHCSMTERRADEATRDAIAWLKCEFMLDKVGEVFDGIVSAVTSFGLFVQLDTVYVEGLVHVSTLGADYFHFDPERFCLQGETTGTRFAIADALSVRVMRVDLEERKIDLELVGARGRHRRAALARGQRRSKVRTARRRRER